MWMGFPKTAHWADDSYRHSHNFENLQEGRHVSHQALALLLIFIGGGLGSMLDRSRHAFRHLHLLRFRSATSGQPVRPAAKLHARLGGTQDWRDESGVWCNGIVYTPNQITRTDARNKITTYTQLLIAGFA